MNGQASDRAETAHAGVVLGPGEGTAGSTPRRADRVGSRLFKAGVADTDAAYVAFEDTIGPGEVGWAHVHRTGEEAFYVLEGEFIFLLEDRTVRAPAGSFVLVPRGTAHGFRNDGDQPARFLAIMSPAELATAFEELSKLGARYDSPEHAAIRAKYPGTVEFVKRHGWTRP